jgi:hypothetical protein
MCFEVVGNVPEGSRNAWRPVRPGAARRDLRPHECVGGVPVLSQLRTLLPVARTFVGAFRRRGRGL